MSSKPSLLRPGSALLLALALTACSGGSDGVSSSGGSSTQAASNDNGTGQQQLSAPDAFISRVMAIISNTSETAEPVEVESITVTTPDDAHPSPVS